MFGFGFGSARQRFVAGIALPPALSAVASDGWQATVASPTDLSLTPFTVTRQGYDGTGAATSFADTLRLTKRVRQPWPDQATLTADRVAMSDYVYATDAIAGATNASTETSPKPIANWALIDRPLVGNTLTLEVVAFHRNARGGKPVACVEFRVTDGTTTVTQKVAALTISPEAGDKHPVPVYRAVIDISTLADNAVITANAKVYPHVGTAASVIDSADFATRREFSPRTYVRNTARFAAPPLVYVGTGGSDTTGTVGSDPVAALANPCATLTGAINRARTVLGTTAGALDGLRVRLTAGTWPRASSPSANTVNAEVVIERAPGVAQGDVTFEFGAANTSWGMAYVRLLGLNIRRMGANFNHGLTSATAHVVYDGGSYNPNGFGGGLGGAGSGVLFVNGFTAPGTSIYGAGSTETRMLRGVEVGTNGNEDNLENWLVLGSILRGTKNNVANARTANGAITAFNRYLGCAPVTGAVLGAGGSSFDAGVTRNIAIVQNVIEYVSAVSNFGIRISSDSATEDTENIIAWHNVFTGWFSTGRANLFYDETPAEARFHKLHSFVGNIHTQINCKQDRFAQLPNRTGGWAYNFGVGCEGEVARYVNAENIVDGGFAQDYAGVGSLIGTSSSVPIDMLFANYAGTAPSPTAGAGNGNYAIGAGSPATARVAEARIEFDLAGAVRGADTAAGAYV